MSKRSKACDITQTVKKIVWERDQHQCIICGSSYAMPNAHYIRRSKGGRGIAQNVVTLCMKCHHETDNGKSGIHYQALIRDYLRNKYPQWNEYDLIYQKYKEQK